LRNALVVVAMCCLAPGLVIHGDGPPLDLAARAKGAEKVVVATVGDVHASFTRNKYGDQLIVSRVTLNVVETLKGAKASALALDVEGGTVGDLTLRVSDMPELEPGERAVFFLERSAPDVYVPHPRGLGVLKLDSEDRVRGTRMTLPEVKSILASVSR
jgi:hypothetical protein